MSLAADIQALDERVLLVLRGVPVALLPFFRAVTFIGGGWGILALLPFLVRRATRVITAWLLAAVAAQSALVWILKNLVGRVRPCYALGWCAPLVAPPQGPSFPSGHATGAFTFAAFVAVRAPRWAAPALVWAALVAASRPVLGVHYPSDVITGAILGSLVGVLFARAAPRVPPAPPPAAAGAATSAPAR